MLLDLERKEIKETYLIGESGAQIKVNGISTLNNRIFAITDFGVYSADMSNPNLIDFNNWYKTYELPSVYFNAIVSIGNKIVVNHNTDSSPDILYVYENGHWNVFSSYAEWNIFALSRSDNNLLVTSDNKVTIVNDQGIVLKEYQNLSPRCVFIDDDDIWWIADKGEGLLKIENDVRQSIKPEGPSDINAIAIENDGNQLIGVAGGVSSSWNNLWRQGELYRFADNKWSNWKDEDIRDFFRIVIDPSDPMHYYIASWGYGLVELQDGEMKNVFNTQNSTLQTIIANSSYIRIGGLAYDRDENLWVNNTGVPEPLSVLKKNGKWKSFSIPVLTSLPALGEMIHTRDGNLWMILPRGNGLFVYNSNNTPDNEDDDEYIKLSVVHESTKVITNDVYSIAEDRQGNIWIGTNKGVLIYYSPSRVFDDKGIFANVPLVPRSDGSGYGDHLLVTEIVTAIKVDGANRKWLGTRNAGVFLVSADGLQQIQSFNEENSPLLSNSINDIAINDKTGEVFFATGKGIVSYTSDAIGPSAGFNDVYVYPNPVREDYFGEIVITGLIENAYVKITDLNGNLVNETRSTGGNAIWDGKNLHGDRVSTGVYLVFCTNEDGSLTHVTKLLFIH